jgi:hypothetical protein
LGFNGSVDNSVDATISFAYRRQLIEEGRWGQRRYNLNILGRNALRELCGGHNTLMTHAPARWESDSSDWVKPKTVDGIVRYTPNMLGKELVGGKSPSA